MAAQPAAGTLEAEGADSQRRLPHVLETVAPTPGGLTIVPSGGDRGPWQGQHTSS